jgi:hypothetical protein
VLYADDTIIFSESAEALEELLAEIEREGEKYGMKLNKKKCEAMCVRGTTGSNSNAEPQSHHTMNQSTLGVCSTIKETQNEKLTKESPNAT